LPFLFPASSFLSPLFTVYAVEFKTLASPVHRSPFTVYAVEFKTLASPVYRSPLTVDAFDPAVILSAAKDLF